MVWTAIKLFLTTSVFLNLIFTHLTVNFMLTYKSHVTGCVDYHVYKTIFKVIFFLYFTSFLNHEIGCMDGSFV